MTFRLAVILFINTLILTGYLAWSLSSEYYLFINNPNIPSPTVFLTTKIPMISLIFISSFIFLWLSLFVHLKNFTKAKQFLIRAFTSQNKKQKTATLSELSQNQNPYLKPMQTLLFKLLSSKKLPKTTLLKDICFSDIVHQVIQLNKKRYPSKINLDLNADIPLPVFSGSLFQAMWELIKNANEGAPAHSHKTQTIITIRTFKKENWFYCEVEDCGVGMNNTVAQQAFNPYFSTKENCIGMGLTLTQKALSRIGGITEIHSKKQGTTITLIIPLDYIEHVQTLKKSSLRQTIISEVSNQ